MEHTASRRAERIKQATAEVVSRIAGPASLITVTGIRISPNLKTVVILITVLPEDKEKGALDFLKRKTSEIVAEINKKVKVGGQLRMTFEIDRGEKNRQRVEDLSQQN